MLIVYVWQAMLASSCWNRKFLWATSVYRTWLRPLPRSGVASTRTQYSTETNTNTSSSSGWRNCTSVHSRTSLNSLKPRNFYMRTEFCCTTMMWICKTTTFLTRSGCATFLPVSSLYEKSTVWLNQVIVTSLPPCALYCSNLFVVNTCKCRP